MASYQSMTGRRSLHPLGEYAHIEATYVAPGTTAPTLLRAATAPPDVPTPSG